MRALRRRRLESPWVPVVIVLVAVAAVVLILRLPPVVPILDGFPLGAAVDCRGPAVDCDDIARAAQEGLAADGTALQIRSTEVYAAGGKPAVGTRSQPLYVVVFTLDDGTRRAAGATCGVGGCEPVTSAE